MCRAFITELRIEHSLHVQFCMFPMWSKSGSSTVPALYPYCAANFGLKYRKRFKKLFVLEQTSKTYCDIPMPIPTGDTLFFDNTEPPLFWSSKLIHLVDCRKVEEEGIIQHRHLHPDT